MAESGLLVLLILVAGFRLSRGFGVSALLFVLLGVDLKLASLLLVFLLGHVALLVMIWRC